MQDLIGSWNLCPGLSQIQLGGNREALKGVKQYMFQDESQMALTHSWCESKWVVTYCYAQNCPSETLTVQ